MQRIKTITDYNKGTKGGWGFCLACATFGQRHMRGPAASSTNSCAAYGLGVLCSLLPRWIVYHCARCLLSTECISSVICINSPPHTDNVKAAKVFPAALPTAKSWSRSDLHRVVDQDCKDSRQLTVDASHDPTFLRQPTTAKSPNPSLRENATASMVSARGWICIKRQLLTSSSLSQRLISPLR